MLALAIFPPRVGRKDLCGVEDLNTAVNFHLLRSARLVCSLKRSDESVIRWMRYLRGDCMELRVRKPMDVLPEGLLGVLDVAPFVRIGIAQGKDRG
jgi:hypothetical protein